MHWQTLIDTASLQATLGDPNLVVIDCRFDLTGPASGERAWQAGHIPGSYYAHLDRDLSDQTRVGRGRHPLPNADAFCEKLAAWGITPSHQVVAYDADMGMFASRFWWMLRTLGHRNIAVLDGGMSAWKASEGAVETRIPPTGSGHYPATFDTRTIATADEVAARTATGEILLLDARAAERFRGEVELLDPRAGHVPGAYNRPFHLNLSSSNQFLARETLAAQFTAALAGRPAKDVVHMCGSGVSACHNLLAMEHAELTGSRVYVGSWSEWVSVPERPVAMGAA